MKRWIGTQGMDTPMILLEIMGMTMVGLLALLLWAKRREG
jgi:LPXTG-motif cell wall-anchored protein